MLVTLRWVKPLCFSSQVPVQPGRWAWSSHRFRRQRSRAYMETVCGESGCTSQVTIGSTPTINETVNSKLWGQHCELRKHDKYGRFENAGANCVHLNTSIQRVRREHYALAGTMGPHGPKGPQGPIGAPCAQWAHGAQWGCELRTSK